MGSSSATRESWLLQSPIQIEETADRVVATLRPMRLVRIAALALLAFCAFDAQSVYDMLFGSHSQHLVCDRHTGRCELNGDEIAIVDELKDAELSTDSMHRSGHFAGGSKIVTLILRNGTRPDASTQGAQSARSIAEYRAVVQAIRAFIADRAQPRLDLTYVYRPSLYEKIWAVFFFFVLAFITALVVRAWRTRHVVIDRATGHAVITSRPLLRRATTQERTIADSAGLSAAQLVAKL